MRTILLIAIVTVLIGGSCDAQLLCSKEQWRYSLTPYLWFSGINGNIAVRGIPATVNASFSDLKNNLDSAFAFHFEGQKGDWGYFVDPLYVKLSAGAESDGRSADIDFTQWLVEFGGINRLAYQPPDLRGKGGEIDLLFGARYWNLNSSIDVNGVTKVSGTQAWVDPIIGLRYIGDLSRLWQLSARADIGGFGVGSHFSENFVVLFGYNTSEAGRIILGYRWLGVNRTTGSGSDYFKYDVTYRGPILGYSFLF